MISFRDKLLGGALLVGFSLCSWAARDNNYEHQQRINTLIQEIPLRREALLEEVLRVNSNLAWSYDALESTKQNVEDSVEELSTLLQNPVYASYPQLKVHFKEFRQELATDFRILETFKSEKSILRNSLAYLPVAYRDALEKSSPAEQQRLKDIFLETMLYHQNLEQSFRFSVEDEIRALGKPDNEATQLFLLHVRQVLQLNPRQMARLRELSRLNDSSHLTRLGLLYQSIYRGWARQRTFILGLQYGLSLVVLVFLGTTLRKLNQTFAQLQSVNHDLEERVSERTRSLEESYLMQENIQAELSRAQRLESVGHLAAGIAHEINTPIQFVGDNTRFVRDSFEDLDKLLASLEERFGEPVRTALEEGDYPFLQREIPLAINQSMDGLVRVAEIVRSLKAFSHPGGQDKSQADLNEMVRTTVTLARNEWRYVADIQLELEESLPRTPCYASDLNQVLLNLLVNAAHAIHDKLGTDPVSKGVIGIQTRSRNDCVEILVRDSGVGMDATVRERIFDHFFTTKEVGRGTGQGLSIAYDIVVNKHGGRLLCESEPGQGTCFIVALPMAA